MKKHFVFISIILAATFCLCRYSSAQTPELIDLPLKFEITARGDGGFFSSIHSIAIDQKTQSLYALHDDPAAFSEFYLRDGNRLGMTRLDDKKVFAQATVAACEGRVFILSQRRLWELDSKKNLVPIKIMPDGMPAKADLVACYPPDAILLLEEAPKTIDALAWNGVSTRVAAPTISQLSRKTVFPFQSALAIAADFNGTILLLDPASDGIRRLTPGKMEQGGISLAGPSGSQKAWRPSSFAVDSMGNIWVANSSLKSLDVYNSFGDLRLRVEQTGPSGFRFISPDSIVIDKDSSTLFMIDGGASGIKAFDISGVRW